MAIYIWELVDTDNLFNMELAAMAIWTSFQLDLFDSKSIFQSLFNVLALLKTSFLIANTIKLHIKTELSAY